MTCSCTRTRKTSVANLLQDGISSRTKKLEVYPMEHNITDSVNLYAELREKHEQKIHKIKSDEEESNKLLINSKKLFENALKEKNRNVVLSQNQQGLINHFDDSIHVKGHTALSEPQHRKSRSSAIKSICGPGVIPEQKRVINHIRHTCKYQPGICRHIQRISSQYQVVCTSDSDECQYRWNSGQFGVSDKFFLVPLHDKHSKADVEDDVVQEMDTNIHVLSEHLTDENLTAQEDGDEVVNIDAVVTLEDNSEKDLCRRWDEVMTITSKQENEEAEDVFDENNIVTIKKSEYSEIDSVKNVAHSVGKVSQGSKDFSVVHDLQVKQSTKDKPTEKKPTLIIPIKSPIESVIPETENESEPTTEPESEPEIEPRIPSLLCPSSPSKSHQAEIKKWLEKSSFSAARQISLFTT